MVRVDSAPSLFSSAYEYSSEEVNARNPSVTELNAYQISTDYQRNELQYNLGLFRMSDKPGRDEIAKDIIQMRDDLIASREEIFDVANPGQADGTGTLRPGMSLADRDNYLRNVDNFRLTLKEFSSLAVKLNYSSKAVINALEVKSNTALYGDMQSFEKKEAGSAEEVEFPNFKYCYDNTENPQTSDQLT